MAQRAQGLFTMANTWTHTHTHIHSLKSMGSFARCVIIRSRQFCPAVHNVKELAAVDDTDLLFLNDMDKT